MDVGRAAGAVEFLAIYGSRECRRDCTRGRPQGEALAAVCDRAASRRAFDRQYCGRPVDFGKQKRERYKGRNVVERCCNTLTQRRRVATRFEKTAVSDAVGIALAAALQWA